MDFFRNHLLGIFIFAVLAGVTSNVIYNNYINGKFSLLPAWLTSTRNALTIKTLQGTWDFYQAKSSEMHNNFIDKVWVIEDSTITVKDIKNKK